MTPKFPQFLPNVRLTALATLVFFLVSTTGWAAPAIQLSPDSRPKCFAQSFADRIEIPTSLGQITKRYISRKAPASNQSESSPVTVIHIQDPHGQYEAQKNIRAILEHLEKTYQVKTLFLEGGSGKLDDANLKIFKDQGLNREVADILAREGFAGGPEMFLAARENGKDAQAFSAYGVEDAGLYLKNLKTFRHVASHAGPTEKFFERIRIRIKSLASREFNPELKRYFQTWAFCEEQPQECLSRWDILQDYAIRHLGLDLEDPYQQMDWPQAVRFTKLHGLNRSLKNQKSVDALPVEWSALKTWLGPKGLKDLAAQTESYLEGRNPPTASRSVREFFERFYAEASSHGFDLSSYPNLKMKMGERILTDEIHALDLIAEVEQIHERILKKLAVTDLERDLIRLSQEARLSEKLLSLQLVRDDFGEIQTAASSIAPGVIATQLDQLENSSRDPELPDLDAVYGEALRFYEDVAKRDQAMLEKMMETIRQQKISRVVLVTGGFHAEGIEKGLKGKGISFVTVTPKMSEIQDSKTYLDALRGTVDYLTPRSYLRPATPVAPARDKDVFENCAAGFHLATATVLYGQSEEVRDEARRSLARMELRYVPLARDGEEVLFYGREPVRAGKGDAILGLKNGRLALFSSAQVRSEARNVFVDPSEKDNRGTRGSAGANDRSEMRAQEPTPLEEIKAQVVQCLGAGESLEEIVRLLMPVVSKNPALASGIPEAVRGYYESLSQSFDEAEGGVEGEAESETKPLELPDLPQIHDLFRAAKNLHDRAKGKTRLMPTSDNANAIGRYFLKISAFGNSELASLGREIYPEMTFFGDFSQLSKVSKLMMAQKHDLNREFQQAIAQSGASVLRQAREFLLSYGAHFSDQVNVEEVREVLEQTEREATQKEIAKQHRGKTIADPGKKNPEGPDITGFSAENLAMGRLIAQCVTPQDFALVAGFKRVPSGVRDAVIRLTLEGDIEQAKRILAGEESPVKEPSEIPVEVTREKEAIDRPESVQETLPMPEPGASPVKLTEPDSQEIKVVPVVTEEPSQGTPEFSVRLEKMSRDYLSTSLADLGGWTAEELADHLYSKGLADPGSLAKIQTLFSQRQSELSASGGSDLNIQKVLEAVEFLQRENKEVLSKLKAAFDGMAKLFFEKSDQKSFMSYEKRIRRAALISNATLDFAFEGPEASQTFLQKVQQLGVYLVQSLMADQSIGTDEQSFYRKVQSLGRVIQYRLDSQKGNRDDLVLSLASNPNKMDEAKTVIEALGLPALGGDVPEWFRSFYEDAKALGSPSEGGRSEVRTAEVNRLMVLLESARDLANDDINQYVMESDELLGMLSGDLFEKLTRTRSRGLLDAISIRLEATNLSVPSLKKLRLWNMIAKADARKIKSPYLVERADSLARQIQSYRPSRETRSEVRSQPKTVLIVEAYESLRQGYEILVGSQFPESKILRAKNTDEALAILRDQGADLDAILTGPDLAESAALDLTRETLDEARARFRGSVVSVIRDAVVKSGFLIPMVVIVNHADVPQNTGLQLLEDPPALIVSNSLDSIEQGLIYVMEMSRSELRRDDDETEEASPRTQMGYFEAPARGVVASTRDLIQKMNVKVPAFTLNYDQSSERFDVLVNQKRVNWNGKVAYEGYYNPFYDVTIAADGEQGNALLEEVRRGIDRALNEGRSELTRTDLEEWNQTVSPKRNDFLGGTGASEASDLKSPEEMRKKKIRLTHDEKRQISLLINEGYSPALAELGTFPGQTEMSSLKWLLGDEVLSDFVQHAKHLMYEGESYPLSHVSLSEYIRGYFRDVLAFHETPMPEFRRKLIKRYKRFALSELFKKHPHSKLAILHGATANSWKVVVEGQDGDAEEDFVVMEPVVYQFKRGRAVRDDANYREKALPGEQIVFARWKGQRFLFYTSITHGIQNGPIRAWKMGNYYVPYFGWMVKETPENLAELPVGLSRALDDALAANPEIARADESAFADRTNELGFSNFFDYPFLEEIQQLKYLARIDAFVKTLSDFAGRNFQIREALERVREKGWDLEMVRSHEVSYAQGEVSGYIPHAWFGEIRIGGQTQLRIVRDSQWVYSLQQEREGEWQRIPGAEFSFNENDPAEQVVMVGRGRQVNIPGLNPEIRIVNPLENDRTVSRAHVPIRARPGVDGDALFQFQRFSEGGYVFISVFDSEVEKYNRWILWEQWKEFSERHGLFSGSQTVTCLVDRFGVIQENFWTAGKVVPPDWEPLISGSGWKAVHFKLQNLKVGRWRLPVFQWGTRKFFEPLRVLGADQDPKGLGRDLRDLVTLEDSVARVNEILSRSENRVQVIPAESGISSRDEMFVRRPELSPSDKETAQPPATDSVSRPDLVSETPSFIHETGKQPRSRADVRVNPESTFNALPPEIDRQLKKLGYPFPSPLPLIEVAIAAGTTVNSDYATDRKIPEFLLGLMVPKVVSLEKTLAPEKIQRLQSLNQNALSAVGNPGETLPAGGTIFMDEKGLLDFAKYDSRGFIEFLSVLSVSMTEGNRSKPLVTAGDQKLFKDLEMILKNKYAGLPVRQQGEIRSLMAQVMEVAPAGDDLGQVIRQGADQMGWVVILSNENLLTGLPEGANFAFKNGLDKENARLIMRSLLSRMRILASLLHKAPLESRATLLEQFEQRQLGGTRKSAGGYVFDNILALAESLMMSMQAVARSA